MDIEEIFDGRWVNEREYVIRCPICSDSPTHNHLYINPKEGIYHCFYCGTGGKLKGLIEKYGGGQQLTKEQKVVKKKKYELIDFSEFPKVTGMLNHMDRVALSYLISPLEQGGRGLSRDEVKRYDMRLGLSDRFYGRVIIPIYEGGKVVCFSARSFLHFVEPKYLFPYTEESLLSASKAIFNYNRNEALSNVAIVEGIFDAIALNRIVGMHGMAILSKTLSESQLKKLLNLSRDTIFYVMLDADAYKGAFKVAESLYSYDRDIRICFLEKGDPAAVSENELLEAIDNAREFSFDLKGEMILPGK